MRTLKLALVASLVLAILGWFFLAPPIGFYSYGTNGELTVTENNTFVVYSPKYRLHWTGMSIQSGNFKQDNRYLFCWFWSGYGIESMKIYSDSGQLLHDKTNGAKKEVFGSTNFSAWFDAEQDWLNRDASVYLTIIPGETIRVVVTDKLGNKFDKIIKTPAA